MTYLVVDTNIPLLNADNILTLGNKETVVVLPETVLAELDAKKKGFDEINYQARETARLLSACSIEKKDNTEFGTLVTLTTESGATILIAGLDRYTDNPADYGGNDRRIIETTKKLTKYFADDIVKLVSADYYIRLQAYTSNIEAQDFIVVDESSAEYTKELVITDPEVFRTLHNTSILDVDSKYKLENYTYKFEYNGQIKLATIVNGFVNIFGKDTATRINQQNCAPLNAEQKLVSAAIQETSIDLVLIEGQAGSGKNITALSNAMKLLDTNKSMYESIVYIRTPINDEDKGEDIGYVSGNDEKLALYLGPMEDTLDFIVRSKYKKKASESKTDYELRIEEETQKMKTQYNMESRITTGLRGMTFHNAVVILDEWQNASPSTAQKVLTRMGKNTKVIVTGSQRQIDNKYVTKFNNGLAVLMDEARYRRVPTDINMFAIELKKVVRSEMAMFAEELFSKA